jgi:hypothetical protein
MRPTGRGLLIIIVMAIVGLYTTMYLVNRFG